MVISADNDSAKYPCNNDDQVKSRDHDAGASNLTKAGHTSEKENAVKLTNSSRAKPGRCDTSSNTAQTGGLISLKNSLRLAISLRHQASQTTPRSGTQKVSRTSASYKVHRITGSQDKMNPNLVQRKEGKRVCSS